MQPKPRREQLLNAAASSATGAAVIFLTNPLDCLKQRWQVAPTALTTTRANAGLLGFGGEIVASEGFVRGLWMPGWAAYCCACSISVGTRLGLYPQLRDAIGQPAQGGGSGVFSGCSLGSPAARSATSSRRRSFTRRASRTPRPGAASTPPPSRAGPRGCRRRAALVATCSRASAKTVSARCGAALRPVARGAVMSATQLATYDASKKALTTTGRLREVPPCTRSPRLPRRSC